jgi:hypothetical protein
MSEERLSPVVMAGLKEFQRATVDYVFQRLYMDREPVHRFLVADEVGLGKTLVARGLIARAVDHLRAAGVRRIDVIYICSNADIAQQNIRKLNITGQHGLELPTRLTLLATQTHRLQAGAINFISFTPGTAFAMGDPSGRKDERALLYWLLRHAWGARRLRHPGVFRLLRGWAGEAHFPSFVLGFRHQRVGRRSDQIDPVIANRFKANLAVREAQERAAGIPTIRERFDEVAERLRRRDRPDEWRRRQDLVGELRGILARSAIDALEPDLIILDEFQRFRHLLEDPEDEDDTRTLARQLFDYESLDGHARTLLLSATPYKMYTLAAESDHDDHYEDFVKTTEFLLGTEAGAFRTELRAYREALLDLGALSPAVLRRRRRAVETRLRQVMARTERLAATDDRAGMLVERALPLAPVTTADVRGFLAFDRVSQTLRAGDAVEYWKSAPYPLSFMEGYEVKKRMRASAENAGADVAQALAGGDGLLDPELLARYEELDPGNGRLRALGSELLDAGAWRLLWIPASFPYYRARGPFAQASVRSLTKRLVFSSWTVVPQAVASVLSYEAERRMMLERDPHVQNTPEARRRRRSLLQFRQLDGRAASMTTFGLVFPSPTLARFTDPVTLTASEHRNGHIPSAESVMRRARLAVTAELAPIVADAPTDGVVDDDWYWAAPILLERRADPEAIRAFVARSDDSLARAWTSGTDGEREDLAGLAVHLRRVGEAAIGHIGLGRPPDDLAETLAVAGLAGPANVALRALARGPAFEANLLDPAVRDAACRVAWGFRSLFGIPEVMSLIRGRSGTERAYWRRVLGYCLDGNLQAVMDEYGHILPDWLGLLQDAPTARAAAVAEGMVAALTIRAPLYGYDAVRVADGALSLDTMRVRARFALRFGVDATDEAAAVQRSSQVRAAFNSPFWPFVLVTTSIGQEGLDFHQYCHSIVHWNLPANPVDFEQREGRVHRYKGHAVRRNVAARHRREAFDGSGTDPWNRLFEAAARSRRAQGQHELVPYWIYEGPHRIERLVPMLPLSREIEQLVAWLSRQLDGTERARYMAAMRVDLSPARPARDRGSQ